MLIKKYGKKIIAMIIIAGLLGISIMTYLVNNGYTNEESVVDDNFYEKLESIENDDTSFFPYSIFFEKAHADNTIIVNDIEKKYILTKMYPDYPLSLFQFGVSHWNEFPQALNSYDYLNKTKKLDEYIKYKNEFNKFYKSRNEYSTISHTVNKDFDGMEVKFSKKITYLPAIIENDEAYQFMIRGLGNNKNLINTTHVISQRLGYDKNLVFAAILTEQFRYAGTYRGVVKSYLKKTPFIFSMTQFSYGIGGIKEKTGDKIFEDSLLYGAQGYLKTTDKKYKDYTRKQFLEDKYYETVYPNILIYNIISRWEKAKYSIKDKPGIILTLYNFGNDSKKKPHGKPQVGGAQISLNEDKKYTYSFGGLGEALYFYIKINKLYDSKIK